MAFKPKLRFKTNRFGVEEYISVYTKVCPVACVLAIIFLGIGFKMVLIWAIYVAIIFFVLAFIAYRLLVWAMKVAGLIGELLVFINTYIFGILGGIFAIVLFIAGLLASISWVWMLAMVFFLMVLSCWAYYYDNF